MSRNADNPITFNEDSTLTRHVYKGWGINAQTSYLFKKNYELAIRYSIIVPHADIAHLEQQTEVAEIGATKYVNGHRIKVQLNVNYTVKAGNYALSNPGNRWGALLQVEVGI
jgi:phosphate-selective porin OprO/OprP